MKKNSFDFCEMSVPRGCGAVEGPGSGRGCGSQSRFRGDAGRPRQDEVGLLVVHGSGAQASWGKGSLGACDSLVDHASTRSRLGSLHFWIWCSVKR
jgi:hypothetical protein